MKRFLITMLSMTILAGAPVCADDQPVSGIGVGMQVKGFDEKKEGARVSKDHPLVIRKLIKDGPSAKAGLKIGDRITKVDGASVDGMLLDEIVAKIRGKEKTTVQVTYVPAGEKERTVTIMRSQFNVH